MGDYFSSIVDSHTVGNSNSIALTLSTGIDSNAISTCINNLSYNSNFTAYTINSPNSFDKIEDTRFLADCLNIKLIEIDLTSRDIADLVMNTIKSSNILPMNLSDCYQFELQKH